jgi:hypothetical protein
VVVVDSTQLVKDHYRTLGVPRSASAKDIKSAWRKKAVKAHPDRGGSDEEFNKLRDAYEILGDPAEKIRYDTQLTYEEQESKKTVPKAPPAYSSPPKSSYDPMSTWKPQGPRGRPVPEPVPTASSVWRSVMASNKWPKFVRDNARTASVVLVTSWVAWALGRAGTLHTKSLNVILGHPSAPSLGAVAILVTIAWAWGLAIAVNRAVSKFGVLQEFASWVGAAAAGIYLEPVAWNGVLQQASLVVLGIAVAWMVFARAVPTKAMALVKWRPAKKSK